MANNSRDDLGDELPRSQEQSGTPPPGRQLGGGPSAADMAAPGGSSGSGGYGNAQNQQLHQGQEGGSLFGQRGDEGQSRGERFDEAQGGGRGGQSVSGGDDLAEDQAAHQDRGQSVAEAESDRG
ncbi:MAG TPA: hypothetical protein VF704_06900 [Allosphingosinicella sp.]